MVANRFGFATAEGGAVTIVLAAMLALSTGCSSTKAATPQVTLIAMLGPGSLATNGAAQCQFTTASWLQIGTQIPDAGTVGVPDPLDTLNAVPSGHSDDGAGVTVSCTVAQTGPNTFDVNANAQLDGQGSLTLSASMLGSDATMVQPNVTLTLERGMSAPAPNGTFSESDCTFDYGQESPANQLDEVDTSATPDTHQGIAPGRIWGNIICPNIVNTSGQTRTCQAYAELRFENCNE
jgi:hypothetical protein